MGIYIRDMKMPTSEEKCKFFQPAPFRAPFCVINGVCHGVDDCPLVPVPPHGDLIDRDALGIRDAEKQAYEAYLKERDKSYVEGSFLEYMQGRLDGLNDASGRVRFAPTIIPAEEGE